MRSRHAAGLPEKICDDCGRPWDWLPDGKKTLYLIGEGQRQVGLVFGLFDVATRAKSVYLEHRDYTLARARFSSDGRWITFIAGDTAGAHIVIAPVDSAPPRPMDFDR